MQINCSHISSLSVVNVLSPLLHEWNGLLRYSKWAFVANIVNRCIGVLFFLLHRIGYSSAIKFFKTTSYKVGNKFTKNHSWDNSSIIFICLYNNKLLIIPNEKNIYFISANW